MVSCYFGFYHYISYLVLAYFNICTFNNVYIIFSVTSIKYFYNFLVHFVNTNLGLASVFSCLQLEASVREVNSVLT